MKKCSNPACSYVWADEYEGTCDGCGRMLAGNMDGGQANLNFTFRRQIQEGQRETAQESSMKRGRYDGVGIPDSLMEAARDLIVQREEVRYEET